MIAGIFAACLVLSFLFTGLESAILSVTSVRVRHQAKDGTTAGARRLDAMMRHREQLLSGVLLLNTALNLTAFAIITKVIVTWLGDWGYLVAFALCLPLYVLWMEFLPKSLFRNAPYRTLKAFQLPLWLIYQTLGRLMATTALAAGALGLRKSQADEAGDHADREEFKFLTNMIERQGSIGTDERRLIESLVDFSEIKIEDIMIPISRTTAVPPGMPIEQLASLARETGIDEFPLLSPEGGLSGIVDVLEIMRRGKSRGRAGAFCKPMIRATNGSAATEVLQRLRGTGSQLAAVVDHQKRPLGIVSAEDIIGAMLTKA